MKNWNPKPFLAIALFSAVIFSCGTESETSFEELNDFDSTNAQICDENLIEIFEIIEMDSTESISPVYPYNPTGSYYKMYHFINSDLSSDPFPLLDQFHKDIDTVGIWNDYRLDTIFDIDNLYDYDDLAIQTDCYPKIDFISPDSVSNWIQHYEEDHKSVRFPSYYTVSKPIISEDGRFLLIEFDQRCYGNCGTGSTYLYQKQKDGWSKVWYICRWVS